MSMIIEQIKEIRECAKSIILLYDNPSYQVALILKNAADTIEELSAKLYASNMERSIQYYNGGWIPIEEKLPGTAVKVLATYEYTKSGIRYIDLATRYGDDDDYEFMGEMDDRKINPKFHKVIAWRPLPEPYKAESEG